MTNYLYTADNLTTYSIPVRGDFAGALGMVVDPGGHLPLPAGITPRYVTFRCVIDDVTFFQNVPIQNQTLFSTISGGYLVIDSLVWTVGTYCGEQNLTNAFPGTVGPQGPQGPAGANGTMPSIANNQVLGNISGVSAVAYGLTRAQLTALNNNFSSSLPGLVPASGGGTTNFLRADGSWTAASGGGLSWTRSSAFSLSSALKYSWTHGLGYKPTLVVLLLTCATAEHGFAIGDTITYASTVSPFTAYGGATVWANSVTAYAQLAGAGGYPVASAFDTSGNPFTLTTANWTGMLAAL